MKKFIVLLLVVLLFTSCGMGWEQAKKDLKSDLGGGIDREIAVMNLYTGEVVWEFSGIAYISDASETGDFSVIFRDENGSTKKADFIGLFYGIQSLEK